MCVGCTTDPAVELYFEAYLQSLTSLVHNTVTRMVYAFRTAIVKHSCNEGLASLAAASIQSVKHFINRVRCSLVYACLFGLLYPFLTIAGNVREVHQLWKLGNSSILFCHESYGL